MRFLALFPCLLLSCFLFGQFDIDQNLIDFSFIDFQEELSLTEQQSSDIRTLKRSYSNAVIDFDATNPTEQEFTAEFSRLQSEYSSQVRNVLDEEQVAEVEAIWLYRQVLNAQDAYRPYGIGLSPDQAEQVVRLGLTAGDPTDNPALMTILDDGQAARYLAFYEREMNANNNGEARRRKSTEEGIAVFNVLNDTYIDGLREVRAQLESQLSEGDQQFIREQRQLRRQWNTNVVDLLEEVASVDSDIPADLFPEVMALVRYSTEHFPSDFRPLFYLKNAPEPLMLDFDGTQRLVETNREKVAALEAEISAVMQATLRDFDTIGDIDTDGSIDMADESLPVYHYPTDGLSDAFIEVFLFMEPAAMEEDE